MANIIDDQLLVRGYELALRSLERNLSFLQWVLRLDAGIYSPEKSVVIPIPSRFSDAEDVVPSSAPAQGDPMAPQFATVTINKWKRKGFTWTDEEQNSVANGVLGAQSQAAINSLARTVVKDVLGTAYKQAYQAVGVPGQIPFTNDLAVVGESRKKLNRQGADIMDRYMLLDSDADGNASILPAFTEFNSSGTDAIDTMRTGNVQVKGGFRFGYNGYLEEAAKHTNNTASPGAYIVNGANQAIGSTSLIVSTGSGIPNEGTLFTIAGDPQEYVIRGTSSTAVLFQISPPLRAVPTNGAVITIRGAASASGFVYQSLAFGREAIAFASRPDNAVLTQGAQMIEIPNPNSGLVLNLEVSRQNKQTLFDYSIRYGFTVCRPELLVRVFGATE
jgi:hypothetical protein